jgi:hypothetical protein
MRAEKLMEAIGAAVRPAQARTVRWDLAILAVALSVAVVSLSVAMVWTLRWRDRTMGQIGGVQSELKQMRGDLKQIQSEVRRLRALENDVKTFQSESYRALVKIVGNIGGTYLPTELEAREQLSRAAERAQSATGMRAVKAAADYFPPAWPVGIMVVRYYDRQYWPQRAVPQAAYLLLVKTQGGILHVNWGLADIYVYKSWTEVKAQLPIASDGSTARAEIWRGTKGWMRKDVWDDAFWMRDNNIYRFIRSPGSRGGTVPEMITPRRHAV